METDFAEHSAKVAALVSQSALVIVGFSANILLIHSVVKTSQPPSPLKLGIFIGSLYLPSFVQMISLPFGTLKEGEVKSSLSKFYPNIDYANGQFTGTPAAGNIFADYGTLYPMIMPIPCYVFILIVRFKILRIIRRAGSRMSERTRELHMQLVKALTYHACLPIFIVIADVMITVMLMDLYRHPLLENFFTSLPSCLSPILTFIFIRPYRA
ncbi:hypothetical protein PENTCL1PPCAC_21117 [Pristionchus entomophagus]|uniref:G protein-coupled receptor n=1 Tax=Pristionchus entomophagus TaxID=358040 RepID=A0AAV5TXW2_9BILA|nr:hypothetical protein PENTCL1PPCAC_21117 [Pristionchus entomophagus]